jgi:hypothetical protein
MGILQRVPIFFAGQAEIEVTPSGNELHWEKVNVDCSVPALLAGVFGTAVWMA